LTNSGFLRCVDHHDWWCSCWLSQRLGIGSPFQHYTMLSVAFWGGWQANFRRNKVKI